MAAAPPITYRRVDPNATRAEAFARRGDHLLYMAEQTALAFGGWVADMPVREVLGDNTVKVDRDIIEQIVLPFVTLADDAKATYYGDTYITQEAYSRMVSAVLQLAPGAGTVVGTVGQMYEEVSKGYRDAPDALKEALTLERADLDQVEPDQAKDETVGSDDEKAYAVLYNQMLAERRFLSFIALGDLISSDGRLRRLAKLGSWLGNHVTSAAREEPSFNRKLVMLRNAIEAKEGHHPLENDELAEGVRSILATTSIQPMLMRFSAGAGCPQARAEMRTWLQVWGNDTVGSEAHLASLLRDNFVTAAAGSLPLRVLIGCSADGLTAPVDSSEAYQATAAVALRVGARAAADPFGPAACAELVGKIGHLTDLLGSSPMKEKTMQERMDYVVTMLQQGARADMRSSSFLQVGAGSNTEVSKTAARLGAGTVPKHYQDRVASAQATSSYLLLKRAILQRLARGGEAADLDALQLAITGVVVRDDGTCEQERWAPLIHMMAEGGSRGLQSDLVDADLAPLATISKTSLPELLGRAVALQLSVRSDELPEKLIGFELTEVVAATTGDDFSKLDLGAAYRKARAGLREEEPQELKQKPYTTKEDCEDALKVAEVVLTLRGFPGDGKDTIPYVLQQVIQTWELYGGYGCSEAVADKIASKGAEYVLATLKRFGVIRHAMLSGKDPHCPRYASFAPLQAIRAFDKHVMKLEGSMAVEGYIEYGGRTCRESTAAGGGTTGSDRKKKLKPGGAGAGGSADAKGWSLDVDHSRKVVAVTQNGQARGTYSFAKLNEHAAEGRRACLKGLVVQGLRVANTISVDVNEAMKCKKCSTAAASKTHAWKTGSKLAMCKAGKGGAADDGDTAAETSATKRARVAEKKKAADKQLEESAEEQEEELDEETDADETGSCGSAAEETEGESSPSAKRQKSSTNAARGAKRGKGKPQKGAKGFPRQ